MRLLLHRHPDTPSSAVEMISVEADRTVTGVRLVFRARGETARIRLPRPAAPARRDGLWRTTCFEAFLARPAGGYAEYNFAPSGEWAAYSFTGYRAGMAPLDIPAPQIACRTTPDRLEVAVDLALPFAPARLGLAAVIEAQDGHISYWALAHPAAKPDFHHPDSFAEELP
jgi:hypothetical protein